MRHHTIGSVNKLLFESLYASLDKGPSKPLLEYLASGGDPNLRNRRRGWTLLHAACFKGRRRVVEELIAAGADVDAVRDGDAFTPLAQAAHKGHIGCVRALLAAGASLECRPLRLSLIASLQYAQVKSDVVRRTLLAVSTAKAGSVTH